MAVNDREVILIELAKTGEALKYMQEQLKEVKEHFYNLQTSTQKQSEEIKDCFFVTEDNRKQIEELSEAIKQNMTDVAEDIERFKKIIDAFDERRDKKKLSLLQILVTAGALVIGFIVEYFRK